MSNSRWRAWGKVLSALAGGGLTAAGLGPLAGGALGAEAPAGTPPSSEGSSTPVAAPGSGAEPDTGQPSTTTTTIPMPSRTSPPRPATPAPARTPAPNASKAPAVVLQVKQKTTAGKTAPRNLTATHAQPTTGAPASKPGAPSAGNNVAPAPQVVAAQAGALAAELAASAASAQALAYYRIPLFLLPIYQAASVQYGVPWQILAAINEIETNYGSDLSVSTAGAVGWMQFMPATWIQYGVDALNAGYADPYNPVDAIFAAARYLRAAGASSDLNAAILAYNHSAEYVSSVLLRAKLISTYPKSVISTLTGLTDGRPPVTGRRLAWGSLTPAASSSSATARATAVASGAAATPSAAAANSSAPPSPAAAAAAAAGKAGSSARALQLVELISAPDAAVVAVQDGRVVELGSSRKLGRYVILRDTYGDLFTYAGLGSIAPSYRLPKAPRTASASGEGSTSAAARAHEPAPTQPASAGRQAPLTLKVKTPPRRTAAGTAAAPRGTSGGAAGQAPLWPGSSESVPAGAGKVRLFAHPGNPDALASSASAANSAGRANPRSVGAGHPLRRGSVVARGTVLGHVRVPHGARAGHLRFAIRPAGDQSSVDPRPILENWVALDAALHPQGAKGETDLLGATASGAFLLSKSELERAVLSDPGISIYACGRQDIASGAIDKRVLAVLAFLSRSGLKPTVSALRCGHSEHTVSGYTSEHFGGDAVDISAINGIPIAGHEGTGTITDITIRALLTLQGEFVPHQIISLMQYPGAANTLAMPEHWNHIHVGFRPAGATVPPNAVAAATAAHSAGPGHTAPSPLVVSGDLSTTQWDQLFTRIATLATPTVPAKPSSAAIRDPKRP